MAELLNDWLPVLGTEFEQVYYLKLWKAVQEEYVLGEVYPEEQDIFSALQLTPLNAVKVVILGQDPYHGAGQAHGLSFSVKPGVKVPPSLRNIYKELAADVGCIIPNHGHLTSWAKQGVLLLNTSLTVRANEAGSHRGMGWELFTDRIIQVLNTRQRPIVFLLWGNPAQEKQTLITSPHHYILPTAHPSPLAAYRGFFGSRPFSRTNDFLISIGSTPIDWQIPDIP
ncbi:MAG: uracil-DNA glycosylase [Paenibacillaceae bacterium]